MFAIVLVAGVVMLYVAFPHRGQDVPALPWVGAAMKKTVDAVPTIDQR
ncbi:hypothetical protein BJ980_001089 [Nocardioides daedukensis]|uniref:Uncharacterized protein n=1 Tax=Nocardioides daedukensis TaxID=634462 RepID=A0A7Y9UQ29_9ACTN|nr:hypothetical protein [Nocardioides daedukensis]NYG58166.1 hypothetical protein [Nocardioides daedukensis]